MGHVGGGPCTKVQDKRYSILFGVLSLVVLLEVVWSVVRGSVGGVLFTSTLFVMVFFLMVVCIIDYRKHK